MTPALQRYPIDRNDFVDVVLSYVGTPFCHRGRLPGHALDCAGVVVCALEHFGVSSPEILYGTSPSQAEMYDALAAVAKPIPMADRKPGDVLTFAVGGREIHMGIYVGAVVGSSPVEVVVQPSKRSIISSHAFNPERDDARSCWKLKEIA